MFGNTDHYGIEYWDVDRINRRIRAEIQDTDPARSEYIAGIMRCAEILEEYYREQSHKRSERSILRLRGEI